MVIAPFPQPGDFRRRLWTKLDYDLEGRIVTLDALKQLFPTSDGFEEVIEIGTKPSGAGKGCTVYGRKVADMTNYAERLAYGCGRCKNLVLGSPRIEDDNSIDDGMPLSGRRGYEAYCRSCDALLWKGIWEDG